MSIRFLGARRLSRVTDNSTSFERQGAAIAEAVSNVGGEVVDWADDPDISAAKYAPEDRPELGAWLKRHDEYDGIAWARLDRAVRSMRDMAWLGGWARDHRKRLLFAEGPGGGRLELDMTSPMSELILMILAFAAQMEVQAIQERTQGASEYLRSVGRWKGGRIPFGRMPVPHPTEEDGWWLGEHDATSEIIDKMGDLIVAQKSYHVISAWVNGKHPAVTPANHRRLMADPPREIDPDARWNPGMVSSFFRQRSLRGWVTKGGEVVRDEEGEPVKLGPPLIHDEKWHQIQAEMDSRVADTGSRNKSDAHPLLGIIFCGTCRGRMYQGWMAPGPNRKVAKRQYRCAAKAHGRTCAKPAYVTADPVDAYVSRKFMELFGPIELVEVVTIPGVDNRPEIEELEADIDHLVTRMASLRGPAADAVERQVQGRSDKLEKLREQPVVPPRTEEVRTGITYADAWTDASVVERRRMLKEAGTRVTVGQTTRGSRDVEGRLKFEAMTHIDPEQDALDEAAHQANL